MPSKFPPGCVLTLFEFFLSLYFSPTMLLCGEASSRTSHSHIFFSFPLCWLSPFTLALI
eukprot:m.84203 g.84203  ORF g.84203 m.84203 type:complete len:59 (+) comp13465_c2_seq2:544-720(+)